MDGDAYSQKLFNLIFHLIPPTVFCEERAWFPSIFVADVYKKLPVRE